MVATVGCPCGASHDGENGGYYTSARDAGRTAFLVGPFDTHAEALAWVDRTRAKAEEVNARAVFYAFGTVRMKDGYREPGRLNGWNGLPTPGGKIGVVAAKRSPGA